MLRDIRITGFRSLSEFEAYGLPGMFALVGQNGSGKSNVLRALNAFFNGEVEPGKQLELSRDFGGSQGKRKRIRIEGHFVLPPEFNFQATVRPTAKKLGLVDRDFWIARTWGYGPARTVEGSLEVAISDGHYDEVAGDSQPLVEQFLTRLIRFRYLPNHVHPLTMVRKEATRLQQVLLAKIRRSKALKKQVDPEGQLRAMAAVADDLITPVARELRNTTDLESVRIEPPTDWTQVALALGISLKGLNDESRDAEVHGSGHQSVLSLALLHFLDAQYSAGFGWHQGNIWAIEEPESFLHYELSFRVAQMLGQYVRSPRFQIILSTHSPVMMGAADSGMTLGSGQQGKLISRDLIDASLKASAAPFVHPILIGEAKPLLVVEGITDVQHLNDAYSLLNRTNPWEIRAVEEYGVASGVTGYDQLMKYHANAIRARRLQSPVILLFDHGEKPPKVDAANMLLNSIHPGSHAVRWDSSCANPDLDPQSFAGIEAFLSTDAIRDAAVDLGFKVLVPADGSDTSLSIKKADTSDVKRKIAQFCQAQRRPEDYALFGARLEELETMAGL